VLIKSKLNREFTNQPVFTQALTILVRLKVRNRTCSYLYLNEKEKGIKKETIKRKEEWCKKRATKSITII
jgi:hypothetical protein